MVWRTWSLDELLVKRHYQRCVTGCLILAYIFITPIMASQVVLRSVAFVPSMGLPMKGLHLQKPVSESGPGKAVRPSSSTSLSRFFNTQLWGLARLWTLETLSSRKPGLSWWLTSFPFSASTDLWFGLETRCSGLVHFFSSLPTSRSFDPSVFFLFCVVLVKSDLPSLSHRPL